MEIKNETVWLSVAQMAVLFDREESNIRRHVSNVFAEKEVEEDINVQKIHINNVKKPVPFYSMDVIISVGYRVKSSRGMIAESQPEEKEMMISVVMNCIRYV